MWRPCAVPDCLTYRFSLLSFIVMLSMIDKAWGYHMTKQSILTFDRWDFLATRVVLGLIAVATWVGGVIFPVFTWLIGEPLVSSVVTGHSTPLDSPEVTAKAGVELTWPGDVDVSIPDADPGAWLVSFLPGLLVAIAATIVVSSLLRLLSRIEAGDDFGRPALRTLRLVGFVLLIAPILVMLAAAVANSVVLDAAVTLSGDPAVFSLEFGAAFVVAAAGLVCAALGEAFGRLADDVEGLV